MTEAEVTERLAMTGDKRAVLELVSRLRRTNTAIKTFRTQYLSHGVDEAHLREFLAEIESIE